LTSTYIEEYLPFELELRYSTAYASLGGQTYDCLPVIRSVSTDEELNKQICAHWSFKNIEHMKLWFGALYYGKEST